MNRNGGVTGEGEPIQGAWINGVLVQAGSLVRLHPSGPSELERLALRGRSAAVDRIEVDFEGRVTLAVVLDPDPAAATGMTTVSGRRFICRADEVVPLPAAQGGKP